MNAFVLLTLVSVVGVATLFVALAIFLHEIAEALEEIGGPATRFHAPVNYLSKIHVGLRAIEVHTGAIAPHVTKLNAGLSAIRDGLGAIDRNLAEVISAVSRQGAK